MNDLVLKIKDEDLSLITQTLNSVLAKKDRVTASDIFDSIGEKLNSKLPKTTFQQSLSANIREGRISGFHSKKGRFGGIFKGDAAEVQIEEDVEEETAPVKVEKPSAPIKIQPPIKNVKIEPEIQQAQPVVIKPYLAPVKKAPAPVESMKNSLYSGSELTVLFISGEKYQIPCHWMYINVLLKKVFKAKEDDAGNVKFKDQIYIVQDIETFKSNLLWFLNASIIHVSKDPNREPKISIPEENPFVDNELHKNI